MAERTAKMEEHRARFSESVYQKVKSDYLDQKQTIQKSFDDKKSEIEKALQILYGEKSKQESEIQKHNEVLEEAKFRNFLGEFSEKKFKEIESRENESVQALEGVLQLLQEHIKQYEDILDGPIQSSPAPLPESEPEPESEAPPQVELLQSVLAPIAPEVSGSSPLETQEIPDSPSEVTKEASLPKEEEPPPPAPVQKKSSTPAKDPPGPENIDEEEENEIYLIGDEGDYFESSQNLESEAKPSRQPSYDETPPLGTRTHDQTKISKQGSAVDTSPPAFENSFDDSISSILRGIPLEGKKEEEPAPPPASPESISSENTGEVFLSEEEIPAEIASEPLLQSKLMVLEGALEPSEYILGENTSMGRSPSNDIILKEAKVSRQHAAINLLQGNYVLVDLKSSNGVFVNGEKIEEHILQHGDEISVGSFKMRYEVS